jgi:hypothetical protein
MQEQKGLKARKIPVAPGSFLGGGAVLCVQPFGMISCLCRVRRMKKLVQ